MMSMESAIRRLAGILIVFSVAMGYLHSPYWHIFTAFVGVNLLQSSFTGVCPAEYFLERLGLARKGVE